MLRAHTGAVTCVRFAPDGTRALTGGADGRVVLWDVAAGRRAGTVGRHLGAVRGLSVTHDWTRALSCSSDGLLTLWHLPLRRRIAHFVHDVRLLACDLASAVGAGARGGLLRGRRVVVGDDVGQVMALSLVPAPQAVGEWQADWRAEASAAAWAPPTFGGGGGGGGGVTDDDGGGGTGGGGVGVGLVSRELSARLLAAADVDEVELLLKQAEEEGRDRREVGELADLLSDAGSTARSVDRRSAAARSTLTSLEGHEPAVLDALGRPDTYKAPAEGSVASGVPGSTGLGGAHSDEDEAGDERRPQEQQSGHAGAAQVGGLGSRAVPARKSSAAGRRAAAGVSAGGKVAGRNPSATQTRRQRLYQDEEDEHILAPSEVTCCCVVS